MKPVIYIDLDATLAYDTKEGHIGPPIKGAVEFMQELSSFADVVVYTCRCSEDLKKGASIQGYRTVMQWLEANGIPYADIYTGHGKPVANAYVDDRNVVLRPQEAQESEVAYKIALDELKEMLKIN